MLQQSMLLVVGAGMMIAGGATAQSPLTADSVRGIAAEMTALSHHAVALSDTERSLQAQAQQLMEAFRMHNADACEYPPGQPELCTSYDMERFALNGRSGDLQKSMRASAASRQALQARFEELIVHLRAAEFAPALAKLKSALVACADGATPSAAGACLRKLIPGPMPLARHDSRGTH